MPDYHINCEAFQVRMGDVAVPRVERGLHVKKVDWGGEEYGHEQRHYVDPAFYPGREENILEDGREPLAFVLDEGNPPRLRRRKVHEFSMSAELLRHPLRERDFISPEYLYARVMRSVGRAALVSIVDCSPRSFKMGSADVTDQGLSVLLHEFRADYAERNTGTSVMLVPEHTSVRVRQEYRTGLEDEFDLMYYPESSEGLKVLPVAGESRGGSHGSSPESGPNDEGGSDREPRYPIVPSLLDEAAEPEPETEDRDQADAVMPFRETG